MPKMLSTRWLGLATSALAVGALVGWALSIASRPEPPRIRVLAHDQPESSATSNAVEATADPENSASKQHRQARSLQSNQPGALSQQRAWKPRFSGLDDPARVQAAVQMALSSDRLGLAEKAAVMMGKCFSLETRADKIRATFSDPMYLKHPELGQSMRQWLEIQLRQCQALDSDARSHWDVLLQRAIAEGRIGSAADLAYAFSRSPYEEQVTSELMTSIHRDAMSCDTRSLIIAYFGSARQQEVAVSAVEKEAFREMLTFLMGKDFEPWSAGPVNEATGPSPPVDAEQVRQVVESIKSHCKPPSMVDFTE